MTVWWEQGGRLMPSPEMWWERNFPILLALLDVSKCIFDFGVPLIDSDRSFSSSQKKKKTVSQQIACSFVWSITPTSFLPSFTPCVVRLKFSVFSVRSSLLVCVSVCVYRGFNWWVAREMIRWNISRVNYRLVAIRSHRALEVLNSDEI